MHNWKSRAHQVASRRGKSSAHLETSSPLVNTKERTSKPSSPVCFYIVDEMSGAHISHDYTRGMHQQVQVALLSCMCVCVSPSPPYPFYLFQFQTLLPFKCNDLFVAEGLCAPPRKHSAEKVLPSHCESLMSADENQQQDGAATRTGPAAAAEAPRPIWLLGPVPPHSNSPQTLTRVKRPVAGHSSHPILISRPGELYGLMRSHKILERFDECNSYLCVCDLRTKGRNCILC